MAETTEYKCPACGSTLRFDPTGGALKCDSCDNKYAVDAMDAYNKTEGASTDFKWSDFKATAGETEQMEDVNVYICESCGAAIETDKATAATKCPYCDSNVILDDKLSGGMRPNAIIPFKLMPKDLPAVVRGFCKGKRLLPKGFFSENKIGKLQGIYVPFWLYDCHMEGELMLNAARVRRYRSGNYDVTETSYFLLERGGEISFAHIPVDASEKMDDDLMDSVEPFDFNQLVDFDKGYLSGFLANRFDTDPDEEIARAMTRMKNTAVQTYMQTAPAYTNISLRANNTKVDNVSLKYAMLPVYLLNCTYKDKTYRYAINGQSGKVVGEVPISGMQMLKWGLTVGGAVFAAVFIILYFLLGGIITI